MVSAITEWKGKKVRINHVDISGNTVLKDWKLKYKMKDTKPFKWYNPFNNGKYLEDNLEKDIPKFLELYYTRGYRDAHVKRDTVYFVSKNRMRVDIEIEEGSTTGTSTQTEDAATRVLGV